MNKLKIILEPVVHEDVWLPDESGRHPDVLDLAVLGLVPYEIAVVPLLTNNTK